CRTKSPRRSISQEMVFVRRDGRRLRPAGACGRVGAAAARNGRPAGRGGAACRADAVNRFLVEDLLAAPAPERAGRALTLAEAQGGALGRFPWTISEPWERESSNHTHINPARIVGLWLIWLIWLIPALQDPPERSPRRKKAPKEARGASGGVLLQESAKSAKS